MLDIKTYAQHLTNATLDIVGIYRKGFGFLKCQTFAYYAEIIATYITSALGCIPQVGVKKSS